MKNDGKQVLVMVDNINVLMNGCYTKSELDFIEVINEFVALSERDPKTSVAIGVNRDLFEDENDSMTLQFYRDLKNTVFD